MRTSSRDIKVKESGVIPSEILIIHRGHSIRVDRNKIPELIEKLEREQP